MSEIFILADEVEGAARHEQDQSVGICPVHIERCWRFGDSTNALRIRRAVMTYKPDVVFFNIQFATFADKRIPAALGLLTPTLLGLGGVKTVVLLHNIMETVNLKKAGFGGNPLLEALTRISGRVITQMLLSADLVAVTIPKYVEILTGKYGSDRVVLAPHGAFEDIPAPSSDLPSGPLQIMTFGKFGTYKRVEALIEAFSLLKERCSQPLELVIAGTDSPNTPGYLKRVEEQYAQVSGIRFTGYVAEEDVAHTFQNAAVVVFPYNSTTGSSGVLHQAGSYGKAVALPNLGDFAELIGEEGYTGEFFEPDNPESMATAIQRFIEDPAHRQHCGMQNYVAASGLPMSEVIDWYLLHFERLLRPIEQRTNQLSREVI
ncbi:MAG: glycosyltransferase [Chloroflexota bacterium]|nr:glycosyltransferase [Chloroflexota bacterium]